MLTHPRLHNRRFHTGEQPQEEEGDQEGQPDEEIQALVDGTITVDRLIIITETRETSNRHFEGKGTITTFEFTPLARQVRQYLF